MNITELSPEELAALKERILKSVERARKARGEVAVEVEAAKVAKAKKPRNVKLDSKP